MKRPKKPFIIECRYIGPLPGMRQWTIYQRYDSERARDEAIKALRLKLSHIWEFRTRELGPTGRTGERDC